MMRPLRRTWSIFHTRLWEQEMETHGSRPRGKLIPHNKLEPLFWWKWRRPLRHISDKHAKRLSSPFQLISMIPKDKLPRMQVKLLTLRLRESLMSQQQLPLLSDLIKQMERSLPFMILEVVLLISQSLRFQEVYLKLRPPMEIPPLEERISIWTFKNSSLRNSNNNMVWTSPRTSSPSKELERLPKRQRLSFLPLTKLKLISHIFQLTLRDQSICNFKLPELNSRTSLEILLLELSSHLIPALRIPALPRTRSTRSCLLEVWLECQRFKNQ